MAPTTPVGTWGLTNYTTMTGTAYPLQIDANNAVAARIVSRFAPAPAIPAALSLVVGAGNVFVPSSGILTEIAAQTVVIAAAPTSNSRIDRVVINASTGIASVVAGTVAASPVPPAIPAGCCPIAQVTVAAGTLAIASTMIADERDLTRLGLPAAAASGSYSDLTNTPTIGTAANNLVRLDGSARLPAVDGSQLTNLAIPVRPTTGARQCVLSGVTSGGQAGYISWPGGYNTANLAATATPLVVTAANGFNASGQVDVVATVSADVAGAWTVTPSSTGYLYIDLGAVGATTPTVTYGVSTLLPLYQATAPASPASGQHWFNTLTYQMFTWSGTAWVQVLRVFVATATTSGTALGAWSIAPLRASYVGGWVTPLPGAATAVNINDGIDTAAKTAVVEVICLTAEAGYAVGDVIAPYTTPSSSFVAPFNPAARVNGVLFATGSLYAFNVGSSTGGNTVLTAAKWAYRVCSERAF